MAEDGIRDGAWDGARAWRFLRSSRGYRKAWRDRGSQPGLPESAPFPVRLQTVVDIAALNWGLLAWEDPYAVDGPAAPFWAKAPMPDGRVTSGAACEAPPLAALAAAGKASLSGLRLGDSALVLRIERDGSAVQVWIPGGGAFPEDGGLQLVRTVERIEDIWSGAGGPAPQRGRVRGTENMIFLLRWKAKPRAGRCATSRSSSGAGPRSTGIGIPIAGCVRRCGAG